MSDIKLNHYIDHTLLKADASLKEIEQLIKEAQEYQFQAVCINPAYVKIASEKLKDDKVKVCTVIGFPLGANTTTIKVAETKQAIQDGAVEIDMVINIGALKSGNLTLVGEEIKAIKEVCPVGVLLKVIIECTLLSENEKKLVCKLVTDAKADYIKTSTGFAGGGATMADVLLMKDNIGPEVKIKASGGIKTQKDALAFIEAGVMRIGTSNGISIVKGEQVKNSGY